MRNPTIQKQGGKKALFTKYARKKSYEEGTHL